MVVLIVIQKYDGFIQGSYVGANIFGVTFWLFSIPVI